MAVGRGRVQRMMVVVVFVALVMEGDAVELEERIRNLTAGGGQSAIQRYSLDVLGPANVYALALLHVAEVGRLRRLGRVGNDGRLHVANKSPLRGAEEGMPFDIRGACPGT